MKALPAVQAAVREEIAARIAAGEKIARVEDDVVISQTSPRRDLRQRRKELMERHAAERATRDRTGRRSVA